MTQQPPRKPMQQAGQQSFGMGLSLEQLYAMLGDLDEKRDQVVRAIEQRRDRITERRAA